MKVEPQVPAVARQLADKSDAVTAAEVGRLHRQRRACGPGKDRAQRCSVIRAANDRVHLQPPEPLVQHRDI